MPVGRPPPSRTDMADRRWMAAALALADRARGRTAPNPAVGCLIVAEGRVVGRGWTQPGGRPHAEAMALAEAGGMARGATVYVTLEPCRHRSARGPACADLLVEAAVGRVVAALEDPDPRTAGRGLARLAAAAIAVACGTGAAQARAAIAGFLLRQTEGRPHVTLKLATSLDGMIATAAGESRWLTGERARAHAHLERARADLVVIGRGTLEADDPLLDVRLAGLEDRSPRPAVLSRSLAAIPATARLAARDPLLLAGPTALDEVPDVLDVLVEGGSGAAAAFVRADRVDRLLLYRAPILLGPGHPALGDIGLERLAAAHGRWRLGPRRRLGPDLLEISVLSRAPA